MRNFNAPIETFHRMHWRRSRHVMLEWRFCGNADLTLKVKLQKAHGGWIYIVHCDSRTNYVVTIGQPVSNPNCALLSGMGWVERNYARPTVSSGGARVVRMDEYKALVAQRRAATVRNNDTVAALKED
jgi:hypothetical protein